MAFTRVLLKSTLTDIQETNNKTNNQKIFIGSFYSIEV
jgi:hypothetical protein